MPGRAVSARGAGHTLVIGVDGVRFDLLGQDTTPAIWGAPERDHGPGLKHHGSFGQKGP
jgi:hypothetical protein